MTVNTCVKRLDEDGRIIGGYGVVFGDAEHTDLEGTYFTAETNFWLDHYTNQPLIYDHALSSLPVDMPDDLPEHFVYGHVIKATVDSVGVWVEAQIDAHNEWVEAVLALIDRGVLHWSSGSVPHLVTQERDGWLSSWPIIEWSTTPTPAEPRRTEVVRLKHFVNHQDAAQAPHEDAPDEGAQDATRGAPVGLASHTEPGHGRINPMNIKKKAEALVTLHWESIEDAVKQGNAIEELARPVAEQLSELAGISVEEALALIVSVIAERAGAGEPEPEAAPEPEGGEDMMAAAALNVDMDALAKKIAQHMQAGQAKGAFLTKNVNLNLNRENQQPESLARFIRAIRDHDRDYLNRRQARNKEAVKALGINPDTAGGYLVAPEQSNQIIELLRSTAVVLPLCREVPLNRDTLNIPKLSTGATVSWVGENAQINDSSPTFGQITLVAKKMATMVKISNELLEDSDPAVDAIIREDMGRAMANEIDRVILLGSGVGNEPRGLLNHADVTKTPLNKVPTYADLRDLIARVEAADVATDPTWAWVFNPREKSTFSQIDDERGGYIWTELGANMAMVGGYPATLLGFPYASTTQLDIDAGNNDETEVFFGQWNDVIVGMRKTIEIMASAEAGTSFEYDQTWIRAILRMDVNIRHAESIEVLTDVRAS